MVGIVAPTRLSALCRATPTNGFLALSTHSRHHAVPGVRTAPAAWHQRDTTIHALKLQPLNTQTAQQEPNRQQSYHAQGNQKKKSPTGHTPLGSVSRTSDRAFVCRNNGIVHNN